MPDSLWSVQSTESHFLWHVRRVSGAIVDTYRPPGVYAFSIGRNGAWVGLSAVASHYSGMKHAGAGVCLHPSIRRRGWIPLLVASMNAPRVTQMSTEMMVIANVPYPSEICNVEVRYNCDTACCLAFPLTLKCGGSVIDDN